MDDENLLKSVDWKVFETQASLISDNVTTMQLELAREWLKSEQFFEIVEERATEGRCGNPICKNSINIPASNQHYRISFKEKKIYEIDQSSNYCSKECSIQAITYASSLNNNIIDRLRKVKGMKNTAELSSIISEKIPTTGKTIDDVLNVLSPSSTSSPNMSSINNREQTTPINTSNTNSSNESEYFTSNSTQAVPVTSTSNKLNIPKRLRRRVPRIPPPILPDSHTPDTTINHQNKDSQPTTDEDAEYEHTLLLLQEDEDQKQFKTESTTLSDVSPQTPSSQNDTKELLEAFSKCVAVTENKIIEKSINLPTSSTTTPPPENHQLQLPQPPPVTRQKKSVTFHSPPAPTPNASSLTTHPSYSNNTRDTNISIDNANVQPRRVESSSSASTTLPIGKGILMLPFVVAKDDVAPVPMPRSHTSTSSWIESFDAAKVERRFDRPNPANVGRINSSSSSNAIPPVKNKVMEKNTTATGSNITANNKNKSIFSPIFKGNSKHQTQSHGQGQEVMEQPTHASLPLPLPRELDEDVIMSRQPIQLQPGSTVEVVASDLLIDEKDKQEFQRTYGVYLPIPDLTSTSTNTYPKNSISSSSSINKKTKYNIDPPSEYLEHKENNEQELDNEEEEEEEEEEEDDIMVNKAPDTLFSQLWIVLSELFDYEALDALHLKSSESKQSRGSRPPPPLPSALLYTMTSSSNGIEDYQDGESKTATELVLVDFGLRTGQEAMWQLLLRGVTSVENRANLKSKLSSTNYLLYNKCKTTFLEFTNFDRLRPSFTTSEWSLLGTLVIDAIIRKNNFLPFQPIIKDITAGKTSSTSIVGDNQRGDNWTDLFLELIQFFVNQGASNNNNNSESYKIDTYEIDLLRSYFDV